MQYNPVFTANVKTENSVYSSLTPRVIIEILLKEYSDKIFYMEVFSKLSFFKHSVSSAHSSLILLQSKFLGFMSLNTGCVNKKSMFGHLIFYDFSCNVGQCEAV